jgi:hypothetical protein
MLLQPSGDFTEVAGWNEPDTAAATVKCKSVLVEHFQDLPRLTIILWRGLEIQAHINHRMRALGAHDLAWDVVQPSPHFPFALVAVLPLPMLERLPATEASEVVAVVMPRVPAHKGAPQTLKLSEPAR